MKIQVPSILVGFRVVSCVWFLGCGAEDVSQELADAGLVDSGVNAVDMNGQQATDQGRPGDAQFDAGVTFADAQPLPERPQCDDSSPPVVLAHGFLASSDAWAGHVQRFVANGHCEDRYHAFDWNSLDRSTDHSLTLDAFIDGVLMQHGGQQVDLMGHSAGGGLGYSYLELASRAAKVRRYVHVGSFPSEGPAGPAEAPVPTLNLWSPDDVAVEGADIPGATNVQLPGDDHYAVATSEGSFAAIYGFLHDAEPVTLMARVEPRPIVSGRMVTLGENMLEAGGQVEVWSLGQESADRMTPIRRFLVGEDGRWGPFVADPEVRYEFFGIPADPTAPRVRYFRDEFTADLSLMYLRTLPGPGSIASVLLNLLPLDGDRVAMVVYNAREAFLAGRDSLTLDGVELLTEQSASAANTTIALFVFDVDNDGVGGGTSFLFDMFPFLAAVDLPIEAMEGQSMSLSFNGRTLKLPRERPSDGVVIAVFD